MTKIIETAAMALGGLSLFAVSFVGFSVFSGRPLRDVALIGGLLPPADEAEATPPAGGPQSSEPPAQDARTERQVVEASLGTLGAWSLPSPFTPNELRTLTEELKARLARLDLRQAELERASAELEADREVIAERFGALEEMRKDLEAFKAELILREQEVLRDEGAARERENERWTSVARVLSGLEDEAAGRRLASFTPEEGAQILLGMEETRAAELLNQLEGKLWKDFVGAYTEARALRSGRPR